MKLRRELFVADLDVSIAFYERVLGVEPQRRDEDYASLGAGEAVLGPGPIAKLPADDPGPGFTWARLREDRGAGVGSCSRPTTWERRLLACARCLP